MSSSRLSKEELKACIANKTVKGQISCSTLRKIAETMGVTYKQAGKAADELKVKIRNCDLGCF